MVIAYWFVCPLTVVLPQIFFNLTTLFPYPVLFSLFHAPLDVVVHFLVFRSSFRLESFLVKQGKVTTVQDRSGKCLTEERQTLNRWTEYCSELYNHKANGDPSVLNCTQTDTEDDHPILHREVEAAVQSLKKGKSAGVDNIPAELVQAGGEDVITALTKICNKIWQTGE